MYKRQDLIDLLAQGARDAGVQVRLLQQVDRVDLSGATPRIVTAQGVEMQMCIRDRNLPMDGFQSGDAIFSIRQLRNISIYYIFV